MALTTDQLKNLSRLYDRWQSGDVAAREAVQREVDSSGADVARAFASMFARTDAEASATLLPPIPKAMRDAAVLAVGESDAGAVSDARTARASPAPFNTTLSGAVDMPTREPGQHVGPYRLIKELGRGGMGVVWLAERADGQHSRQVALKMPLVENLNWLLAARFARERNILASLEHPSIARLYDAGVDQTAQSTQPYIAIEYVVGLPITAYVRENKLKPEATVQLFTRVIEAVAHAHAQLVIHRDIKPSNILVDAKGEPHLLDFGIAKLLDDDDTMNADATQLTRLSGRALTLDYASPEQVNNAPLGVASDVYALGVVLYEVLTGSRPYHPKGPTRRELEEAILEQEPTKPSDHLLGTGTSNSESGKSARRMRGDLDTIVLKALRKDPKLRYAAAQAFADDLKRYLSYQPIQARPDGALYRLTKFIRRQRVPLVIAVVSCAAIAGLSWRAWQQQQVAQASSARAESIDGLMKNIFQGMSPDVAASRNLSAKDLLDRAQHYMNGSARLDEATHRAASLRFATLYRQIEAFPEALAIYEQERALAVKQGDARAEASALWELANLMIKAGQLENAARVIEALRLRVAAHDAIGPRVGEINGKLSLVEGNLALVRQDASSAFRHFTAAENLLNAAPIVQPGLLAWALQGQGSAATDLGRPTEARERLLRAHALYGQASVTQRIDQLQTDFLIAELDISIGSFAAALERLKRVVPELEARLRSYDDYVLSALELVATAQMRIGLRKEATDTLAQLTRSNVRGDSNVNAFVALRHAQLQMYGGDAKAAVTVLATLVAQSGTLTAVAQHSRRRAYGEALLRTGRNPEALALLDDLQRQQIAAQGESDPELALTRVVLACAQARNGDLNAARSSVSFALPILLARRGPQHPATLVAQSYGAIFNQDRASGGTPADVELANRVDRELGWQADAAALAAWLRATTTTRQWQQMPAVL